MGAVFYFPPCSLHHCRSNGFSVHQSVLPRLWLTKDIHKFSSEVSTEPFSHNSTCIPGGAVLSTTSGTLDTQSENVHKLMTAFLSEATFQLPQWLLCWFQDGLPSPLLHLQVLAYRYFSTAVHVRMSARRQLEKKFPRISRSRFIAMVT